MLSDQNKIDSQEIISYLVEGDSERFAAISSFAAALLPLLSILEREVSMRDLAETIPLGKLSFTRDLFEDIIQKLGYEIIRKNNTATASLHSINLPCLFIDEQHNPYVIYEIQGENFVYFEASTGATKVGSLNCSGTRLNFTVKKIKKSNLNRHWFSTIISRFRSMFVYLLSITFVLNFTLLSVPIFLMFTYEKIIGEKNIDSLPMFIAIVVAILAFDLMIRMIRARLLALPAGRLEYLLGTETLDQLLSLPAAATERTSVTMQMAKFKLYDSIREFFTGSNSLILLDLPFIPILIMVMFLIGGNVGFVPIITIVIYFLIGLYAIPKMRQAVTLATEARSEKDKSTIEILTNLKEIKSLSEESAWIERMTNIYRDCEQCFDRVSKAQSLLFNLSQAMIQLASIAVIAVGGFMAIEQTLSIAALVALMAILWRIVMPIQNLLLIFFSFYQISYGIRSINELMSLKRERSKSNAGLLRNNFSGNIILDRVGFRYSQLLDPVLMGVSLTIKSNETIAIVGRNSSGKSTLLKLLCGMYYPQIGHILLDDMDIRQFNTSDLRHTVSYLPQQTKLFPGDIFDNLRMKDILANEAQLLNALKQIGIWKKLNNLQTQYGNQAVDINSLSPGLLRQICIARTFIQSAEIILLDEPESSLDIMSQLKLTHFLKQRKGSSTIIFTTQQTSLIQLADRVILVDRGQVAQIMKPDEYLKIRAARPDETSALKSGTGG